MRGRGEAGKPERDREQASGRSLDQHLDRRRMAEERGRARGQPVGAGLEDHDQVADLGPGQRDVVGEQVERRAQAADDADLSVGLAVGRLPIATG